MNKFLNIIAITVLIFPTTLFAADINFKSVSNDSNIVEVRLDPKSKNINVVEGVISVNFDDSIKSDQINIDIENGNSILSLWPIAPSYNAEKKEISFTGGIPLGVKTEGLLFKIKISSGVGSAGGIGNVGNIKFAWAGGSAYLNDGKGTKESITSESITLSLAQDVENTNQKNVDQKNTENISELSGFFSLKNVTILLLSIIVLVVLLYAYKKTVKNKNTI